MRAEQPKGEIAAALAQLLILEQQFAANAAGVDEALEPRVYPWRPNALPELPCIWNWLDDGTYEIVDQHRADDLLVMRVTIGVKPSDFIENADRLVKLMDIFRATVDPSFEASQPLGGTVREAKRVVTRSHTELFDGIPVLCLETLVRLKLSAAIR